MGFGSNYTAPASTTPTNSFKSFEWGVHKVKLVAKGEYPAFSIKEAKSGNGYNISCTLEGIESRSALFVSLGYVGKVPDGKDAEFSEAIKIVDNAGIVYKEMRAAERDGNTDLVKQKEAESNAWFEKQKANKLTNVVKALNGLCAFVGNFGKAAEVKAIPSGLSEMEYLTKLLSLTLDTDGVYAFIAVDEREYNGKVYKNLSLSPSLAAPISFPVADVTDVVYTQERMKDADGTPLTEPNGDPVLGDIIKCTVMMGDFSRDIVKSAKNYNVIEEAEPNDTEDDGFGNLADMDTDSLPF